MCASFSGTFRDKHNENGCAAVRSAVARQLNGATCVNQACLNHLGTNECGTADKAGEIRWLPRPTLSRRST